MYHFKSAEKAQIQTLEGTILTLRSHWRRLSAAQSLKTVFSSVQERTAIEGCVSKLTQELCAYHHQHNAQPQRSFRDYVPA